MFPEAPSVFRPDERQSRIRILLVDDHVMFRQCLRNIVDGHAHLVVVGEASNGLEAIDAVHHMRPDVVVMDINMPKMNGIEATQRIKEVFPDTSVIGLSVHQSTDKVEKMWTAGICAYLMKESVDETLCRAIEDAVIERR
ncbi:MAG: response regulator transcription factor [Nitrospirales bacterium]